MKGLLLNNAGFLRFHNQCLRQKRDEALHLKASIRDSRNHKYHVLLAYFLIYEERFSGNM